MGRGIRRVGASCSPRGGSGRFAQNRGWRGGARIRRHGGPPGLRAHDLALGLDRDPFRPWTPPPFWEEAQGLEWEIDSLGVLAGVLETVLERLCRRLAAVALIADALEIRLGLASGGHHARDVSLAYPMSEVKPMLTLP